MALAERACRKCGAPVGMLGWCGRCQDWTTQFDPEAGEQLRDAAEAKVERAADPMWKHSALEAVRFICEARPGGEFTTDAVWYVLEEKWNVDGPRERRALGPVMRRAEKAGYCAKTDRFVKTERAQAHRGDSRVWRSLL